MFEKLWIQPQDFDSDDWKDPEIRGWLLLLVIYTSLCIIFNIASVYQIPYVTTGLKFLVALPSLFGIYTLVSLCLRWRNAVFVAKAYMIYNFIFHLLYLITAIAFHAGIKYQAALGLSAGLDVAWFVYLLRSSLIAVRYPRNQRKVFAGDYVLIAAAYVLTFFNLVFIMPALALHNSDSNKELRREIVKINKDFPKYDSYFYFHQVIFDEGAIIILSTFDTDFLGEETPEKIRSFCRDARTIERFKEEMVTKYTYLADLAKSRGLDLCWRFLFDNPSDCFEIRLSPEDMEEISERIRESHTEEIAAWDRLRAFVTKANSDNPKKITEEITLKEIVAEPDHVIFCHEVNEDKASFIQIEGYIEGRNKSRMSYILDHGIGSDSLLRLAADSKVDLIFRYTGSRTGFSQDYTVVTLEELQDLKQNL